MNYEKEGIVHKSYVTAKIVFRIVLEVGRPRIQMVFRQSSISIAQLSCDPSCQHSTSSAFHNLSIARVGSFSSAVTALKLQ